MAKEIKNRKGEFTEKKNQELPVEVIEPTEAKEIVRITEVDRPLITAEQAKKDWQQYQELINALIKEEDVVPIEGKLTIKKSGLNKVARFFGYSCEIISAKKIEMSGIQTVWKFKKGGGRYIAYQGPPFVWKIWAKAIAPNGRFRVAGAACSSTERDFNHLENDVLTTCETRAKKRAIWELTGMGEIELEENEETKEKVESKMETSKTYKPKLNEDTGYRKSAIVNPKMPASIKQKEYINAIIERLKNDYEIETTLEKPVETLNKGEAADLINKLLAKGKETKKKQEEEMKTEKPPEEEIS